MTGDPVTRLRRRHLFEIEDAAWCPRALRDAATDYLQFIVERADPYGRIAALLGERIRRSGARRVVDLGSGGGGPWLRLHRDVGDASLRVLLTDKYPNQDAGRRAAERSAGAVTLHPEPVDARRVPPALDGFRTLFSSFHHFEPDDAAAILADAARQRQPIAIVEVTRRSLASLLMVLPGPVLVLLATPFIRPFRWSRLLLTYLLPAVPFVVLFDGVVSCLRTYTERELRELTSRAGADGYHWEIGHARGPAPGVPITYLFGSPE